MKIEKSFVCWGEGMCPASELMPGSPSPQSPSLSTTPSSGVNEGCLAPSRTDDKGLSSPSAPLFLLLPGSGDPRSCAGATSCC